ncbi:unnamed protein product [Rhizopus stolonifer]
MTSSHYTIYYGTLVHSLSLKDLEILLNAALVVDNKTDVDDYLAQSPWANAKVKTLGHEQFLMPGFVDTHAHAPQYMFAGSGMDRQLLEWLKEYVFTCESAYQDPEHAKATYQKVIRRFLSNGTTTCSWFATIHLESCKILVDTIESLGQRAFVGKVNMDQNSPQTYIETTESSLKDTRAFVEYVLNKPLVTPVITPRFAITCSSALLKGLGELAAEFQIPIQTHLCENHNEIQTTLDLFKGSKDYTSIYDDHELLNERAYMAHCIHMTDAEIDMLAQRKTGVSHCANSNFSLHSGVCDVRRLIEKGIKVGLGTDVAGGFSPSMLDAIRSSFFASKTTKMIKQSDEYTPLDTCELFYLATLGGAQVLNLENQIGNFQPNKSFDALWVDLENGSVDLMGGESRLQKIEKFLFNGSDQNLLNVYVQGKRVAGKYQA